MAANNVESSNLHDQDLETDNFESGICPKVFEKLKQSNYGKQSTDRRESERQDSGYVSGSLSLSGSLPSSEIDKTPVQCSDAVDDAVNDINDQFTRFTVTDDEDDEAIESMTSSELASLTNELPISGAGNDSSNDSDKSIITQASDEQPEEIYVDLYEQDEDGDTVVHLAIVSLLLDSVLVLIDLAEEADCLNIQNNLRQTALHLAVLTDQPEIVRALVAKGVNINLRDQQGNTALHIACRMGNTDAVSAIVKSLTDLNTRQKYFSVKNNEGLTCMHLAVQAKEYIILGHLLAKGANVNIGDAKSGRTMLHYAVERRDIETVTLLLTHKDIDIDCKTFKGETPVVLAFWRNYQDIVKKLKSNGAYFDYSMVEDSDDDFTS